MYSFNPLNFVVFLPDYQCFLPLFVPRQNHPLIAHHFPFNIHAFSILSGLVSSPSNLLFVSLTSSISTETKLSTEAIVSIRNNLVYF